MLYNLGVKYQRDEFIERVKSALENNHVVDLTRRFPNRSVSQNKYLHLILSWWATYYGCTKEYAKLKFFKKECNSDLFIVIKTSKDGKQFKDIRSSASLSTQEMTLAIQRFRDYCAYQGCYIPSAEEREYLQYVEREVEKNKEYL